MDKWHEKNLEFTYRTNHHGKQNNCDHDKPSPLAGSRAILTLPGFSGAQGKPVGKRLQHTSSAPGLGGNNPYDLRALDLNCDVFRTLGQCHDGQLAAEFLHLLSKGQLKVKIIGRLAPGVWVVQDVFILFIEGQARDLQLLKYQARPLQAL